MKATAIVATSLLALSLGAAVQYPGKPIHIVVPYQAGGTSEVCVRNGFSRQYNAPWIAWPGTSLPERRHSPA
jgi:hypothetical protein